MKFGVAVGILFSVVLGFTPVQASQKMVELRVGASVDSELGKLIQAFDQGEYKIESDAWEKFIDETTKAAPQDKPQPKGPKLDGKTIEFRVSAPKTSKLGHFIRSVEKGIFKIQPDGLRRLIMGEVAAETPPSVQELFDTYYIQGDMTSFNAGVKKISDQGDYVADAFYGWSLVMANFPVQNADASQGLFLMKRAATYGVSSAYNNEAMIYWLANYGSDALPYIPQNVNGNPRDWTNYQFALTDAGTPGYPVGFRNGAIGGDPCGAGALARFEANQGDNVEALTWFLCSYRGATSMDSFHGLEWIINFVPNLKPAEILKAREDAEAWMQKNPKKVMDGFDLLRMSMKGKASTAKVEQLIDPSTVQGLFWRYYAVGDKEGFDTALEPFVAKGDANALYMKAHLARGFVGVPDWMARRNFLTEAMIKGHPLAYLDLALDLLIEGVLDVAPDKPLFFQSALKMLQQGYDKWFETEHANVIGELVFLLGYFYENGIGCDKDPSAASEYYSDSFNLTPLTAGHLGRQTDDPIKKAAFLTVARPSLTHGDWFGGGIMDWYYSVVNLNPQQLTKAMAIASALQAKGNGLTWNFYQRISAGLDPVFSGL